jgi:ribosomal protein L40E
MSDMVEKKPDEKYCQSCGAIIKKAAEICPKCGIRQQNPVFSENASGDELKVTNVGFSVGCGVAISILLSVFVGWIYFLIISSINPNEPAFKKGRNITGILCLIAVGIIALVLLIAGSAILDYL